VVGVGATGEGSASTPEMAGRAVRVAWTVSAITESTNDAGAGGGGRGRTMAHSWGGTSRASVNCTAGASRSRCCYQRRLSGGGYASIRERDAWVDVTTGDGGGDGRASPIDRLSRTDQVRTRQSDGDGIEVLHHGHAVPKG
jgi:hypothetical protein